MAKHATARHCFWSKRLLIFSIFVFFCTDFFAAQNYRNLRVVPETKYAFTGDICLFKLIIPGLSPSSVRTTVQSLPEDVTFISSNEKEIEIDEKTATQVEFKFTFDKPGVFTLPRLAARLDYGGYVIHFDPIEIIENPLTLRPAVFFDIPQNTTFQVGKKIELLLSAKYFHRINSISSSLSENFVLIEKQNFLELPYSINSFSPDKTDLLRYDIIPLKPGKMFLPNIEIQFEAWNQTHPVITSVPTEITVLSSTTNNPHNSDTQLSDFLLEEETQSKTPTNIQQIENVSKKHTAEQFTKLLRITFYAQKILIIFNVFFSICVILFLFLKQRKPATIFTILLSICIIITISISVPLSKKYAIIENNYLYQIPEKSAKPVSFIIDKTLMQITSISTDWIQVKTANNMQLWIERKNVKIVND